MLLLTQNKNSCCMSISKIQALSNSSYFRIVYRYLESQHTFTAESFYGYIKNQRDQLTFHR